MHVIIRLLTGRLLALALATVLFLPSLGLASSDKSAVEPVQTARLTDSDRINVVEGRIRNRTLYEVLTAVDVPPAEILSLSKAFKPVFDFRHAKPKHQYQACIDNRHSIQSFIFKTGPVDEYEAFKNKAGGYTVKKRHITLDRKMYSKVFTIASSLCQAVTENGENQQMAVMIADIFAWDIDFYLYPKKGDRIAVVYERCYKDGQFIKYGRILAARYEGRQKTFSAYLFNDGRFDGYYDEDGQPLKKMFLRIPVKFGRMTSPFSIRRFHPVLKKYRPHTGIDYGAAMRTPIFATANGRVIFSGWKSGYGKIIIVKHPNGYQTYYGHCSRLLKKVGQLVEQGQTIALVGQTGLCTGPHVHYEVRVNGKPINPNSVKKSRGKALEANLLATFKQETGELVALMDRLLMEHLAFKNDTEFPISVPQ